MKIDFSNLEIDDEQLEIMFNQIKEKDKVTELNLSYNDFTKLPDSISGFTNLKELQLINCPNLKDLGKLERVNGDLWLNDCSNLVSLGQLEKIGGTIFLGEFSISKEYMEEFKPQLLDKCNWS